MKNEVESSKKYTSQQKPTVLPLVSIVTVVYNGEKNLETTIKSVISQGSNIEYIIIDGGSTDGTVDIINKYSDKIAYWVSEPDKGLYDAMNKAIRVMRGEGHVFLNAGDYFSGDVLGNHRRIPSFIPVFYRRFYQSREQMQRVGDYRQGMPYCHQGILFESKGVLFDTSYRFAADYLYYLDHGYREMLPFSNGSGHVYYENSGISMQNASVRDAELADIIRSRFGVFQALRFRGKAALKKAVKSVFRCLQQSNSGQGGNR